MDNQRVIMIRGDKSKWYEQIIFIAKKDRSPKLNVNLVDEAERIVENYLSGGTDYAYNEPVQIVQTKKKKSIPFDTLLNVVMVLSCVTLASVIFLLVV